MLVAVCYDVPDDARRTRIFKRLKGFGQPVQKSVFECDLHEDEIARMEEKLRALVAKEDLVRIYRLCEACRAKAIVIGEGTLTERPESTVV
ncbi:MAG: CRISPR-associated endonuclease Cas2 [Armatimonadota bacterium]